MIRKRDESDRTVVFDASSLLEGGRAVPKCAQLVVVEGPTPGQRLAIEAPMTRVGRREDCELLLDSQAVSRHHATVVHEGQSYYVIDVGAANGVFVNGKKLTPGRRESLAHGDSLILGDVRLLFLDPHTSRTASNAADTDRRQRQAEADSWMKRVYAIDPLAEKD